MSYSVGSREIMINYVDEEGTKQSYNVGVQGVNTYWEVPDRYNVEGKGIYSGWKMLTDLPGPTNDKPGYDKSSNFSYYGEVIIPQEYSLSYRYINVRELLTNNTIALMQIMNGGNGFFNNPSNTPSNTTSKK